MKPSASDDPILLLQAAGLRVTPVRQGVLTVLGRSKSPLDVPALLESLPGGTDAVTVYRTLNTFVRKKLVHRVRGEERSWRYALGQAREGPEHQHPHFVCEQCGRVECLSASEVPPTLTRALKVDRGYAVSYTEVIVHGQCVRCR
ncbi:MAG TPA: transcriptional repressor [Tepidisphaeraceae bacterium]|jgi:Fe2+ or Zn2+ uptake regulation protein